MRKAEVFMHGILAGVLEEIQAGNLYRFTYHSDYFGPPISLTLPRKQQKYEFDTFPTFFEGLLPEGAQLDALLRIKKIDPEDLFSQLVAVGTDLVGAVILKELK